MSAVTKCMPNAKVEITHLVALHGTRDFRSGEFLYALGQTFPLDLS
jgi:hypothetical protein